MTETKKKRKTTAKPTGNRGGKREGAGRKTKYGEEPLASHITIRVRSITQERIRKLRDLTKQDTLPFNQMFESWVEEMAKDYGIE